MVDLISKKYPKYMFQHSSKKQLKYNVKKGKLPVHDALTKNASILKKPKMAYVLCMIVSGWEEHRKMSYQQRDLCFK